MILALDIGNTHITVGGLDEERLYFLARITTVREKTEYEYGIDLKNLLELHGYTVADIDGTVLSSVVPPLTHAMTRALKILTGKSPVVVGPGVRSGLNILLDNPAQLGADLVVAAVAALSAYEPPLIIFDLGTATTVSVVDRKKNFLGGLIFPGVLVGLDALFSRTSQLPHIALDPPEHVIGSNTVDSMKSGAVFGNAAMVDGLINRIEDELGEGATVIATGGVAPRIIPHCRRPGIILDENLLLTGLLQVYRKNAK